MSHTVASDTSEVSGWSVVYHAGLSRRCFRPSPPGSRPPPAKAPPGRWASSDPGPECFGPDNQNELILSCDSVLRKHPAGVRRPHRSPLRCGLCRASPAPTQAAPDAYASGAVPADYLQQKLSYGW